jgi:transcriptional regulator with XRE-family HTH domain
MQEDMIVQITTKLKDIRKEKNLTLQELADTAGVTKGMLSQVENNRTIPSLTVFLNIIKSLKIDINDFFQDFNTGGQASKVIFKKKTQYQPFEKENTIGYQYHRILSTTVDEYHVDFVLLTLMPNAQRAFVQTDAFEFKYMLKGKVEYTIGEKLNYSCYIYLTHLNSHFSIRTDLFFLPIYFISLLWVNKYRF